MNSFEAIPREILTIIHCFLNHHDYRQLLNTSKAIFQVLKYETVYYNLKITFEIIDYLSAFYESVKDKSQQISLKITQPSKEVVEKCSRWIPGIHKLIFREEYYYWRNIPNISLFCNIYHVHLEWIEGIDRLSGLSGIKILEVFYSSSLIAIDFIPGLKRLVLDSIINLLEISEYGNIPELQITDCGKLRLHGLGNHKKVSITCSDDRKLDESYEPYDLSIFQNVRYFHLEIEDYPTLSGSPLFENLVYLTLGCNGELFNSSYFPNLRFLRLISADVVCEVSFPSNLELADFQSCYLYDLSVLSNVKQLMFDDCRGRGFGNVNALANTSSITFHQIKELEDVSSLGRVYELKIVSCSRVKDISNLGGVHRLCVEDCGISSLEGLGLGNCDILLSGLSLVIDLSPLISVYKVTLQNCDGIVDGRGLSNVRHLTLYCCNNFADTTALGSMKSLYLISCEKLRRLVGLENVPCIHIEDCPQLVDIDCLGKQQSLVIYNCMKLKQLMKDDVNKRYQKIIEGISLVKIDLWTFNLYPSRYFREMPDIFDRRFDKE